MWLYSLWRRLNEQKRFTFQFARSAVQYFLSNDWPSKNLFNQTVLCSELCRQHYRQWMQHCVTLQISLFAAQGCAKFITRCLFNSRVPHVQIHNLLLQYFYFWLLFCSKLCRTKLTFVVQMEFFLQWTVVRNLNLPNQISKSMEFIELNLLHTTYFLEVSIWYPHYQKQ